MFFLIITILELLDKVEDGLYLLLFFLFLTLGHIALNWLELSKLKYEFWEILINQ